MVAERQKRAMPWGQEGNKKTATTAAPDGKQGLPTQRFGGNIPTRE